MKQTRFAVKIRAGSPRDPAVYAQLEVIIPRHPNPSVARHRLFAAHEEARPLARHLAVLLLQWADNPHGLVETTEGTEPLSVWAEYEPPAGDD